MCSASAVVVVCLFTRQGISLTGLVVLGRPMKCDVFCERCVVVVCWFTPQDICLTGLLELG